MLETILKYWKIIELHGTQNVSSKQLVNQLRATNSFIAAIFAFFVAIFFIGFYDVRCLYINIIAIAALSVVFLYNSAKTNNYIRFLLVAIICLWTISTASIMINHNSPDAKIVYTQLALLIPLSLSLFAFHEIFKMLIVIGMIVVCFFAYESVAILVEEQKEFVIGDSILIKLVNSFSLCLIPFISIYNIYLQSVVLLQDKLQKAESEKNSLDKIVKENKTALKNLELQIKGLQDSLQNSLSDTKTYVSVLDNLTVVSFQAIIGEDKSIKLTYISGSCFTVFGFPSQDLISLPLHLTLRVHPEDANSFQMMIEGALETGELFWQGRLRLRSGMYRWFKIQGGYFPEVSGGTWLGSFTDVHEEVLQREQDELRIETDSLLVRYSNELLVQENQDPVLWGRKLFEELSKDFSILYGTLYLPNVRNTHFQFLVGFGVDEKSVPAEYPIGTGTIGTVAQNKRITFWKVSEAYQYALNTALIVPQSIIVIPLIFNFETQGIIELHTHFRVDENNYLKLDRLSNSIAASLISLRTQLRVNELLLETQKSADTISAQKETLSTSLTELELAQTDLFVSKQRLEQQLNAIIAQAIYAEFNFAQRLVRYNHQFCQDLGYTEDDVKEKFFDSFEFRKAETTDEMLELWPKLLSGERIEGQFTIAKKLSGKIWCTGSIYPLTDTTNQVNGAVLIATNKTDEHEKELKLNEQERLLDTQQQQIHLTQKGLSDLQKSLSEQETKLLNLINSTEDLIYAIDPNYTLITGNHSFEKYFEQRIEMPFVPNNPVWQSHNIDECDYWKELYWNALNGTTSKTNQRETIQDKTLYFETVINPIRDSNEEIIGAVIFRRNITERKEAELKLKRSESHLRRLKDNLESMVKERTQELEATINDLTSTKSQLVLSEKMAALGQLVAGVAHEINTPIGAIQASSQIFQEILPETVSRITDFCSFANKDILTLLQEFLTQLVTTKNNVSSKESRRIRKQYMEQLREAGFGENQSEEIATTITDIGFFQDITPYFSLWVEPVSQHTLELCRCFGQMKQSADNIQIASVKTRKTAQALKNYSHSSNSSEPQWVDLQENIETILILYQNQLKYNYELVVNLEHVPPIMGIADELGQVWTNIIQNAIHAMPNGGKIQIDLLPQENSITVKITDSGSGIPPENIEKIFQKFFTTKERGVGTGLGLDICGQIIQNHGGTISVQSEPGNTCFTISLPIKTPYSNQTL
ncbi:MAG: PAS domain S-box protein [Bacteroidia bacterium]|nr:PAS domain S-box protein [Bacteroidia bacterium]